jgi:hypothetical protein
MTLLTRINNECPRRYVNRCRTQRIKHTKGHLPLSCFGLEKFSGFRCSKTSANKRLLLCLLPFAADVQTSPAQVHGAKVLQNLRMCKKNRILVRFFWYRVYGVECKGRNLLGGKSPSTKQTGGKCPNTIGGEITIIGNLFGKLVNFLRK